MTKTVAAAVCGVLAAVLVLPPLAALLVSVPAVQNAIVHRLASFASQRIGTRVSIDGVRLHSFNSVEINGLYVEDFDGDTLLHVPRLTAPVTGLGLGGEPVTLGRVKVAGAELWLRKSDPEGSMNISRVVAAISPDPADPERRFRMRIDGIEADDLTFALIRPYDRRGRGAVDFGEFVLRGVAASIEGFEISGDTIRMDINSLACVERTGWSVDRLEAHPLTVSRGSVRLDRLRISSGGSELALPAVHLDGGRRMWRDFREFTDSVEMNIEMGPSRVTSRLVGAFVPAVAGWDVALDDVSAHTGGVLSELYGGVSGARILDSTALAFDFTSRGLPRIAAARIDVPRLALDTRGEDVARLLRSVTGREVPPSLSAMLARLGAVSLREGGMSGTLRAPALKGALETDAGDLRVDMAMDMQGGAATFGGSVSTAGFDLGRLLAIADLGAVAGTFGVNAATVRDAPSANVTSLRSATLHGDIGSLTYRDHRYSDITADGRLAGRRLDAEVSVDDPALEADLAATLDGPAAATRCTLDLDLRRGDLTALGIVRADSVSLVSGRLVADIKGRSLDEANGTVEVTDVVYRSARGTVSTRRAALEARSAAEGKLLTLRSEFADAEFRSRTGYRDMVAYLGGFIGRYVVMPRTRAVGRLVPPDGGDAAAMSNYSIASVDVKNVSPLLEAVFPTASLAAGSTARFMFNPYTGGFSLSAHSQYVEYGGMLATGLDLTTDNTQDSLKVHLSGTEFYTRRGRLSHFELHGGAKGGRTRLDVQADDDRWRLRADSIAFGTGRAVLRNLVIASTDSPGRRLTATGVVSALDSDTLRVRFNRFDISPLGRLLGNGLEERLSGEATGWLDAASMGGDPRFRADMTLSGVEMWNRAVPTLRFTGSPDPDGGVRYRLRNENAGTDILRGTLSAQGRVEAQIGVDSLDAAALDPFLGGILQNTEGRVSVRLAAGGTLGALRLDGRVGVERFATTVGYTRVRYGVGEAAIEVDNSTLRLPRTAVTSEYGGSGDIEMTLDLSNLDNVSARIDARVERMLAYDGREEDNGAFYGRVFATGSARIASGRMGTRIDVSARTDNGTRFHLPLRSRGDASWADFVVFSQPRPEADTVGVLARKRLAYERRLAGGRLARSSKPLELNLTAAVTPAAELHLPIAPNMGPGITGRGEGVIDLNINPETGRFSMTGDYRIASGRFELAMMEVFNKTFEIAPGSALRWSGSPTDAGLSVDASWRTRASLRPLIGEGIISGRMVPVECIIRLRNNLSDPEITFDIALPSADADQRQIAAGAMNTPELKSMQFLSLLTTGSFATDNTIAGQNSNAGVMAGGTVAFDILTAQLNNFLSSDDYDVFFRYRPQDGISGQRAEAGVTARLWGNRLELELEGNYEDNRSATSVGTAAVGNFAGEGSATIEIDRAGNLRLRLFSRTIDRLNETQGQQENGLGIYYRKDFDRLRDIFRRRERRPRAAPATANRENKD